MVHLITPSIEKLDAYKEALERGWSSDNLRRERDAIEQLAKIKADALSFIASIDNPRGGGEPVILPDGSEVPRLPGFQRWIWQENFCGSIGFRWQKGTAELPPHVLGHIGYSVVPWEQNKGYATKALSLMLTEIRVYELPYVTITTDPDNIASQKVIEANGGYLIERFKKSAAYGEGECLRYRIDT